MSSQVVYNVATHYIVTYGHVMQFTVSPAVFYWHFFQANALVNDKRCNFTSIYTLNLVSPGNRGYLLYCAN